MAALCSVLPSGPGSGAPPFFGPNHAEGEPFLGAWPPSPRFTHTHTHNVHQQQVLADTQETRQLCAVRPGSGARCPAAVQAV
jgi:hypothetical protein